MRDWVFIPNFPRCCLRQPGPFYRTAGALCALLLVVTVSSATKTKSSTSKSGATKHVSGASHTTSKTAHNRSARGTSASRSASHGKKGSHAASVKGGKKSSKKVARGQQGIDSDRASEIQAALIREKYMDGEPNGIFDQRTKDALIKYQAAHGWQTKVLPDSRALIKLGLGPSRDGLLNPESAAVGSGHELGAEKEIPGGSMPMPRK